MIKLDEKPGKLSLPNSGSEALSGKSWPFRFVTAAIVFLALLALVFETPPKPRPDSYMAAFIDKETLSKTTLGNPRIIFAGGSSSAFGIDSELVEHQTGMKTINTGLHANLGLRFMLSALRDKIGPGDIVVVVPEYSHFFHGLDGLTELSQLVWLYPQAAKYLSLEHFQTLAKSVPDNLKRKWRIWETHGIVPEVVDSIYCRAAFSGRGDVISHLNKPNDHSVFPEMVPIDYGREYDVRATSTLNDFAAECEKRGTRLFISFPPTPLATYEHNLHLPRTSGAKVVQDNLKSNFRGALLNTPQDNCFDSKLFFNTECHLNTEGRRLHTERLIDKLRAVIKPVQRFYSQHLQQ